MPKKGGVAITLIIIVAIIVITSLIAWQAVGIMNKIKGNITEQGEINTTEPGYNASLPDETNQTDGNISETNETNGEINQTDLNETESPENESLTDFIPNPTGSIIGIDHRDDETGEYFCKNTGNDTVNPEHKIRVYTYKIINETKNLSENYIESEKISNICDDYGNLSEGINYYIEWKWNAVDGINGYRIYQHYYFNVNFSRDYSHHIDIKTNKLIDTGLNLWMPGI